MSETYFNYESDPKSLRIITPSKAGIYVYTLLLESGSQLSVSVIKCTDKKHDPVEMLTPEFNYD